jgi:hypothetical protein
MRVLLLDSEDQLSASPYKKWDLVVDLGRAPTATYERWAKQVGCRVISLHNFSRARDDLRLVRELLQLGMGQMVDASGIDWWDVLSLLIEPNLYQLMLARRLAAEIGTGCELYASRSTGVTTALQALTKAKNVQVEVGFRPAMQWARHYRDVFSQLDQAQLTQTFKDKFDREHILRRRLVRRPQSSRHPVVLLPSAYINVSRTAASYAALLPTQKFLMVYARDSARLNAVPTNVSTISLDPYFVSPDKSEAAALAKVWKSLKARLVMGAEEYSAANEAGIMDRIPGLMRWGIAVRDAWNQVFESDAIAGCLCADDSNPYTRLPLILAKSRGLPTLACHHGAFDSRMAMKVPHADIYIAKGEIERDYMLRFCEVSPEKVVLGGLGLPADADPVTIAEQPAESWLVFFSEPYQAAGWRTDEVYRELLPKLWALAQSCGLRLVLKIHPFESVKGLRRILRKYLPQQEPKIGVMAGAPSRELWRNTRVALTVQSTVALQCTSLGIPVFLFSWLRDPSLGYMEQYTKFGVGHALNSADELSGVPLLLAKRNTTVQMRPALWETMDPAKLLDLLVRSESVSGTIRAQA